MCKADQGQVRFRVVQGQARIPADRRTSLSRAGPTILPIHLINQRKRGQGPPALRQVRAARVTRQALVMVRALAVCQLSVSPVPARTNPFVRSTKKTTTTSGSLFTIPGRIVAPC